MLIIDDDDEFRETAAQVLLDAGFDVFEADCPDSAFPILLREGIDLVLCDLHMPFTSGADREQYTFSFETGVRTVRELHQAMPNTPIIGLSAATETDLARIAAFLDPVRALSKPRRPSELVMIVVQALTEPSDGGSGAFSVN